MSCAERLLMRLKLLRGRGAPTPDAELAHEPGL